MNIALEEAIKVQTRIDDLTHRINTYPAVVDDEKILESVEAAEELFAKADAMLKKAQEQYSEAHAILNEIYAQRSKNRRDKATARAADIAQLVEERSILTTMLKGLLTAALR